MFTATKAARASTSRRQAPGLTAEFAALVHNLAQALFDPYRPELHYMRGRGPRWHAKHDPAPAAVRTVLMPALARVRVQR
jgi:hypothetical protein